MPKPKPTEIIRHEIVLGRSEREMVQSALHAYQFNRVTTPIVAGMSDISFMAVIASILTLVFPNIVIPTGTEQIGELIEAIIQGVKDTSAPGWGGLYYGAGPIDTPRSLVSILFDQLGIPMPDVPEGWGLDWESFNWSELDEWI